MHGMKRVLFVCVENACRSQMAEGFAKRLATGRIEARSAGSRPAGYTNPRAIALMAERGYDLSTHQPIALSTFAGQTFDVIVIMGCGDACTSLPAAHRLDWSLPDPKALPDDFVRCAMKSNAGCENCCPESSHEDSQQLRSRTQRDATAADGCGLHLFEREMLLSPPYFEHMHRFLPAHPKRAGYANVSVPVGPCPRNRLFEAGYLAARRCAVRRSPD